MNQLSLFVLLVFHSCLLGQTVGAAYQPRVAWELPTTAEMQQSLLKCELQAAGEDAIKLRCLAEQLGLWTDEQGYNAKRIAQIFGAQRQMQELMLVIEYCNNKERKEQQPALWAINAYKCVTSGSLAGWDRDSVEQQ